MLASVSHRESEIIQQQKCGQVDSPFIGVNTEPELTARSAVVGAFHISAPLTRNTAETLLAESHQWSKMYRLEDVCRPRGTFRATVTLARWVVTLGRFNNYRNCFKNGEVKGRFNPTAASNCFQNSRQPVNASHLFAPRINRSAT